MNSPIQQVNSPISGAVARLALLVLAVIAPVAVPAALATVGLETSVG